MSLAPQSVMLFPSSPTCILPDTMIVCVTQIVSPLSASAMAFWSSARVDTLTGAISSAKATGMIPTIRRIDNTAAITFFMLSLRLLILPASP